MANTQKTHLNGGQLNGGLQHANCKDISSPPVDEETLSRLESLMNEFFFPNTSNERKRQIESILSEFSSLPNSWQASFLYFELSSNEYTKMFCLTVIETFINQRWHTVSSDMRATFRSSLWTHLIEHHLQMTSPIRNKYCKIIVSIARFDWPYTYPDYMTNVLELLTPETVHNIAHSSSLILLSLNLLGMTVEELTSTSCNYHFSSNRQVELIKLIESNLPAMLHSLTSLLELIISKQINFISATPPPSPTNSPPNTFNTLVHLNKANNALNSVFQMSIKKGLFESIPEMDNDFIQMTAQIFACLSRIIAFMPVTYYSNLNQTLLSAIYVFANFGSFNPSTNSAKLGLAAMACINELMSKASAFNSDANEFIYNVFTNTFLILQRIITSSLKTSNDEEPSIDERPDEDYIKKFIDFLKLFINGHLGRFEKFISFPTKDFLTLLLEFTTKMHHSLECYLMLLDVWSIYLDYLESSLTVKHKDKNALGEKLQAIKEPIFSLLLFVIRSIQYNCNREYLQQLDDCTLDDDGRTEFEQYVQTSIEIVAKIGEIFPEATIVYIDNYFNEKLQSIHYGLEFFVNNKSSVALNGHRYNAGGKLFSAEMCQQPLGQLQLSIHDFITTLQVCSRFSHSFVDEFFERYFARTKLIFDKLVEILQFLEAHHCCDVYHLNALSAEFFLLKAQLLATFKAYIVWFQQLCCHLPSDKTTALVSNAGGAPADALLTTIFNTCCSIICDTTLVDLRHGAEEVRLPKRKLFHSGALTLNTFSANVRPSMVFGLSSVQRLFDQNVLANVLQLCDINSNINETSSHSSDKHDPNSQFSISVTDQILISQSISNLLILPWFALQNDLQEWDRRSVCLNLFVGNFLQLFNKLNFDNVELSNSAIASVSKLGGGRNGEESPKCPNVFCRSLLLLRKVIKSHTDSPVKSKQMLFASLDSSLDAFTQLLVHNAFLHTTVVGCQITEHILALFLVVFDVLLAQMHIDFVKRTIQTLLQIIHTHDVLSPGSGIAPQHGSQKEISALKVIIKFLKLLGLIIKQTSFNAALRSLLPGIIDFTVAHIQTNLISVKSTASIYFNNVSGQNYDTYGKLLKVYYRFLYELMLNNCRYFFPLSNVNKISFGPSNTSDGSRSAENANNHQRHFENIMEIVGQSFMQPENIQLYRQNVEALESLNETIKLYNRAAFKSTFLERFVYLFIHQLLDRSLDLLDELLYTILYHLVEVDFGHFYEAFIPKFLSNIQHLNDMQRSELVVNFNVGRIRSATHEAQIDFPTFTANLNRLLCDIRYYHKCNSA